MTARITKGEHKALRSSSTANTDRPCSIAEQRNRHPILRITKATQGIGAHDKNRAMVSRGGQVQMATRIQLVGMTVEPLNEPHGQTIEQVLSNSSELDVELAGRDPNATTITVWVYPDSFAAFRQLKEHLYARGFATAARPLPMGHAISGGPQGSRSNAQ